MVCSHLKYGTDLGLSLHGSLATDHITTAGLFLSRRINSSMTSLWCSKDSLPRLLLTKKKKKKKKKKSRLIWTSNCLYVLKEYSMEIIQSVCHRRILRSFIHQKEISNFTPDLYRVHCYIVITAWLDWSIPTWYVSSVKNLSKTLRMLGHWTYVPWRRIKWWL